MNKLTMNAIRAMVWKEWRENAPWALLGMIGLSLGILYNVTVKAGTFYYHAQGFVNYWTGLNGAMTVSCGLIAAAMGLLQLLPEQRRDQWAFLVHRPATAGVLFWGKTIAGLTLYLFAVLVPFAIAGVWAAVPGNMAAPFDGRLMLPGIATIVAGAIAYFGAMVTALRPARWYGARALPALIALILAAFVALAASEFVTGLSAIAPILLVIGCAAWSVFEAGGSRTRGAVIGKICVVMVLYAAFSALYGAVFGLTGNVYSEMTRRGGDFQYDHSSYEQYGLSHSGQIVRAQYLRHRNPEGGYTADLSAVRDLSGKTLPLGDGPNPGDLYEWPTTMMMNQEWFGYTNPERYARSVNAYSEINVPTFAWYYVPAEHRIAVYENRSRRFAGLIGANGFRAPGASKPSPLAGDLIGRPTPYASNRAGNSFDTQAAPPLVYAFDHTLYRLDAFDDRGRLLPISHRTMTPIFQTAPNNPIASVIPARLTGEENYNSFVIITSLGIQVIDWRGTSQLSVPWARGENSRDTQVDLAIVVGGKHGPAKLLFLFSSRLGGMKRPIRALVIEAGGKVLQQAMVIEGDLFLAAPPPPAFGLLAPVFSLPLAVRSIGLAMAGRMTFIALSLAVSLAWAALAWRVGVRCSAAPRVRLGWAALCFCFGLPGLLTLLSLAPWPARVICSVCGKRRVVTQEECEHCGVAFPAPPRDGTEIFEPAMRSLHTEAA
ncbi:hypothetical protein CCAX7_65160 [Capsulimonas corticalis]|uniref:Uncharacterized protein n=1 Tax=Capsulimonas corticalis TaxID=2219043 RepID=A0A402CR05_9BACT|nr:hypothetical protein [Capsulimonas corticalis]BDI34465.1 hypothetical protein CCAX7_65160 [Capsulimonas corticalis]